MTMKFKFILAIAFLVLLFGSLLSVLVITCYQVLGWLGILVPFAIAGLVAAIAWSAVAIVDYLDGEET
jgi:hypothetical protein